ncbi:MAG: GNAT family N-acetyltransferase [Halorientalis sp.]
MIRAARPADLPRLRAIQLATLAEPWDGLLEPVIEGPPVALVAVPDQETAPVGYAVALQGDGTAYLAELAVAPGHRRTGHGSALLAALDDRLADRGCARVRLTVRADDEGARAFYAAAGFTEDARLSDHYEDGDAVVLSRPVQAATSN